MQTAPTKSIDIVVNGQPRTVPPPANLLELLDLLTIDGDRVAIELNREIVRRPQWGSTPVYSGAQLEIVQFVGGG